MSSPGSYILGLRQGRQRDREVVAKETGIDVQRQRWIEEGLAVPTAAERGEYARYFEFESLEEFDKGWRSKLIPVSRGNNHGKIPVINLAPAGAAGEYFEMYPDSGIGMAYIDPPPGISGPHLFAFVIIGNSMEPDYPDGYYAICRTVPREEVEDGQAVFVRLGAVREHACTFKRCFDLDDARVELRPINPDYAPEIVKKVDIDRVSPVIACVAREAAARPNETDFDYSDEFDQTLNETEPG